MEFKHKDHFLELGYNEFQPKIQELIKNKKNMLVHIYGTIDSSGRSWCPDCVVSHPNIEAIKPIIDEKQDEKEIYFIDLPEDWDKRATYKNNPILKEKRVPTLIYFSQGREMGRIVEDEMSSLDSVKEFIDQIYED